jgi:hypothetical protein
MTTDVRFAWTLAVVFESTDPTKAAEFAKYGLSQFHISDQIFCWNIFKISHFRRVGGVLSYRTRDYQSSVNMLNQSLFHPYLDSDNNLKRGLIVNGKVYIFSIIQF